MMNNNLPNSKNDGFKAPSGDDNKKPQPSPSDAVRTNIRQKVDKIINQPK